MKTVNALIKRNTALFFKDKGMFFTSMITPMILLVLYVAFLRNVFYDSFLMTLPDGVSVAEGLINSYVGGQLISSILAVSCVTVSFCANMVMVQDKATSALRDLTVSPVKPSALALGYYCSTLISTLRLGHISALTTAQGCHSLPKCRFATSRQKNNSPTNTNLFMILRSFGGANQRLANPKVSKPTV